MTTTESSRSDEVSLRDLYLVLVRGLPLIALLALLAGAAAYLLNARREPVYAAARPVLVTPPPIQIEGDENLSFSPSNEVSFQTYETLARSQLVLEDAVSRLPDARVTPDQLLSLGTLRELIGPQRADQGVPLSVIHRVRNGNPELAAQLADAWAQSTLQAVRDSLFASLNPVDETTTREVARLERNVEEVETRVLAFAAGDNGTLLEAELEGLTRQLTDGRERQGELDRNIAATRARIRALQEQLGYTGATPGTIPGAAGSSAALNPTFLDVLTAQTALAGAETGARARPRFTPSAQLGRTFETALAESDTLSALLAGNEGEFVDLTRRLYTQAVQTLEDALAEEQRLGQRAARAQAQGALELALLGFANAQVQNPPPTGAAESALTLLSEAELRRERVALEGMVAEREALSSELSGYTQGAATLQRRLATLEQRRSRLERELENVQASYDSVAELQSSVSYLTELAPTNARILSQASVPSAPVGPRRAFNTALAATLGGLVGLVLVFLRAAIRPPGAPLRKAPL